MLDDLVRDQVALNASRDMTLAEHDALLKAEGSYDEMTAARRRQDEELDRKEAEWRAAEAPLVGELRKLGYAVSSAWDLVNTSTPYPDALPILLEHLKRSYPDRVREGIARALAVPDATFAWDELVRLYQSEPSGTDAKDGLAVAISATAISATVDHRMIADLIALARDDTHGESRVLLLNALAKSRTPEARRAMDELRSDHSSRLNWSASARNRTFRRFGPVRSPKHGRRKSRLTVISSDPPGS